MRRFFKATCLVLLIGILLVGCQSNSKNKQNNNGAANKQSTNKNNANQKNKKESDFPLWGYDMQQTRHVPYKKITKDNVKNLGVIWQADLTKWDKNVPNASEDFPIVKNGVMYVTTSKNRVFAIDASNGEKKWEWKPPKKVRKHLSNANMSFLEVVASRGVAVAEGNVFVLMADNRLAKLDAKNGKLIKMINLWDTVKGAKLENRYYETTSPMYYDGNIYVGSSGGDNGSRGFVMAYKAGDLKPAWDKPFWTIPPKGKKWVKGKYAGGGSVWTPMSFDPETDAMYFAVGNPAPDFFGKERSGDNPYTDSVVALDSKTGKLAWAKTETGHDVWDYDAAATPMILKAKVNGKKKKIIVEGGKNGKWFAWDAKTGKTIYDGVPFVKIKHSKPPTKKGKAKLQWPGTEGGENYAPQTYDPATNYVLIPGINKPSKAVAAKDQSEVNKKNGLYPGTKILPSPKGVDISGNITAIDVNTGKKVYQKKTDDPMRGGFTSTASGLAYYGELDGTVNALDVKSGKVLWNMKSGGKQIKMAPSIYMDEGKQRIAVISGGTKVVVYGLGGKNPKDIQHEKSTNKPGNNNANHGSSGNQQKDKKQPANENANVIFKNNCASCHGKNLEGKSGPALKHVGKSMSEKDILDQINNGGGRMPAGIIKGDKAKAVAEWLSKKK